MQSRNLSGKSKESFGEIFVLIALKPSELEKHFERLGGLIVGIRSRTMGSDPAKDCYVGKRSP